MGIEDTNFFFRKSGDLFIPSGITTPCMSMRPRAEGAACGPDPKESYETRDSYRTFGDISGRKYQSLMITTTSSYILCKIGLNLLKTLSPTFEFTVKLYDNNSSPSDRPGNLLASSTESRNASTLTTSYDWYTFAFSNYGPLTTDTKYWIVVECATINDTSNYCRWGSHLITGRYATSADGTTWAPGTGHYLNFRMYAYE